MTAPVGTAARRAGREARHAADLHRAHSALTAWMQQQQQQQPHTGPSTTTDIQPTEAVKFLRWYTRQPAHQGAQLPTGRMIVAPNLLRTVSQHCAENWNVSQGGASASRDTSDGADSDASSTSSLDIAEGADRSETCNPFSSKEVKSLCAQYAMAVGRLGFLTKGVLMLNLPGLELCLCQHIAQQPCRLHPARRSASKRDVASSCACLGHSPEIFGMNAGAEAFRPEKVVRLLAHLWGQAKKFGEAGNFAEVVWIYQLGTAACMMQQLNACATDIRCLTLHDLILPGQESGSGLIACVHALVNNLPIPGLEIVLATAERDLMRSALPAHQVDFMSCGAWAAMLAVTSQRLGNPVQEYLFRQQDTHAASSSDAFKQSPVTSKALSQGLQEYLRQLQQHAGESCRSIKTCGAVRLAGAGLTATEQSQAESVCTYIASHVHPSLPWVPCPCCNEFWETEPAQELLRAVSGTERIIDAARTRSEPQA